MNKNKYLIFIAGPTAVGKSALAYHIAEHFDLPIFSADSRQLYKEMSIVTAKPSREELEAIPHYFINHVSISDRYSVGSYEKEFDQKLAEHFEHYDVGIVVGGTGLYIRAILEGLDEFSEVDAAVKSRLSAGFEKHGIKYLQDLLKEHDPSYYAVVDQQNPRRLMRALEICLTTGAPYSDFLDKKGSKVLNYTPIMIGLELPRDLLYARIDQRVFQMVADGLIEEVTRLHLFRGLPALETVGCTEIFDYLDGKITKEEAIALIQRNSRRYAKRQMTWFRKYGDWTWFSAAKREEIMEYILRSIA